MEFGKIAARVRQERESCIDFWLEHGLDAVHGGISTCLDRTGRVYSTDKSVWMQGRGGWTFSRLCGAFGPRDRWLAAAESCLVFARDHCVNPQAGGRMYFAVTADGRPLRQRRYLFSELFYAIACAEFYGVTGQEQWLAQAREKADLVWEILQGQREDPAGLGPKVIAAGLGPKVIAATRAGRSLAEPMIYLNTCQVLRRCDPAGAGIYTRRAKACVEQITRYHYRPDLGATLETVGADGAYWRELSAGRAVNPGHSIECAWFLLDEAAYTGDGELREIARVMFDNAYAAGWDQTYGGLLYMTDAEGFPPEAYEHDMKLWWPHNELLVAALKLYRSTGEQRYRDIFLQGYGYAFQAFGDPAYGEWYGYLRRDGAPTQPPAKGNTFKGPFHLPRMLIALEELLAAAP